LIVIQQMKYLAFLSIIVVLILLDITIQQDNSTNEDEVDSEGNIKESVSLMTIHQAKGLEVKLKHGE
jgi:superfamily I DNA/RNA helicase